MLSANRTRPATTALVTQWLASYRTWTDSMSTGEKPPAASDSRVDYGRVARCRNTRRFTTCAYLSFSHASERNWSRSSVVMLSLLFQGLEFTRGERADGGFCGESWEDVVVGTVLRVVQDEGCVAAGLRWASCVDLDFGGIAFCKLSDIDNRSFDSMSMDQTFFNCRRHSVQLNIGAKILIVKAPITYRHRLILIK